MNTRIYIQPLNLNTVVCYRGEKDVCVYFPVPLKELKCGAQFHGIVDIKAVVASKHQTNGRDEGGDLVNHNLVVYTQHELLCGIAGVSCKENTSRKYLTGHQPLPSKSGLKNKTVHSISYLALFLPVKLKIVLPHTMMHGVTGRLSTCTSFGRHVSST